MPKRLEKSVVQEIIKMLNGLDGCFVRKRHGGPTRKGEPDITGCYKGMRIEIEAKAIGGKLTRLQKEKLEKWNAVGAITGVAYDEQDAYNIIRDILSIKDKRLCQNFLLNSRYCGRQDSKS